MDTVLNCMKILSSNDFGELCRRLRYLNHLSQERLALDVGVSTSTIQRIENGKMAPSINMVCRIADVSGMTVCLVSKESDFSIKTY